MHENEQWKAIREANRRSWNAATLVHQQHKAMLHEQLRLGIGTLHAEERALLGDVSGKRIAHLQCNDGVDTLSLALLGAEVIGVDISDTAIAVAEELRQRLGIRARFVRADIYDWLPQAQHSGQQFDTVFVSYGVFCWLPDLRAWAQGIAGVLAPKGRLVAVDFHPVLGMFDDDWHVRYPYAGFGMPSLLENPEGVSDYIGFEEALRTGQTPVQAWVNGRPAYEFAWGIGDILSAVLEAGLQIEQFTEYAGCPYALRSGMVLREERWYPPSHVPPIPQLFSLVARRVD